MTLSHDPAFEAWRNRAVDADILEVALRKPISAQIKKHSREWVGPCPACGGQDRFAVNPGKAVFNCRGSEGGGVITMVMHVCAVGFLAACEIINGEPPPAGESRISEAELEQQERDRESERQRKAKQRDQENARYREKERAAAFKIWEQGVAPEGTAAEAYLAKRGLVIPPGTSGSRVRTMPQLAYWLTEGRGSQPEMLHSGPAMLLPIIRGGKFAGVHQTYIDLDQPKGKLLLAHPESGKPLDVKKVRGSQQGCHIEVVPCAEPTRLIIGEGYEKVAAVWRALHETGAEIASTAFWTSINLGNLGGAHLGTVRHPTRKTEKGRPLTVAGPEPDISESGIEIPDSVTEIVILGDRSSDEFLTRCTIARAAKRWEHEGRSIRVAWSPADGDFDDQLRIAPGEATLLAIAVAIEGAQPVEAVDVGAHEPQVKTTSRRQARPLPSSAASDLSDLPNVPDLPKSGAPAAAPPAAHTSAGKNGSSQLGSSGEIGHNGAGEGGANGAAVRSGSKRWHRAHGKGNPDDLDIELAFYPQTDLGNAERFVARNRDQFRWCQALGWLFWDGRRWSRDGADGKVKIAEHECVRKIQDEAAALAKSKIDKIAKVSNEGKKNEQALLMSDILSGWGRASEAANRLSPICKHAAAYLEVGPEELDADPFKINVRNGTLCVRRVKDGEYITFKPHDPDDLITKVMPVDYDPEATCAVYDDFLSYVQPKDEMRRFLHQWGGLSLTGDISDQVLFFFWGKGKNGKSTLLNCWAHVAGDYSRTAQIDSFVNEGRSRNAGQATPDLAMLQGRRMVQASEPERGAKLSEALIKAITGGDVVPVRHLNKEFFDLVPEFKLTISGNYRPRIEGADDGIWRRVHLVPWVIQVPQDKRDKTLPTKLKAEASGVLNRLLDGLRDWLDNGLVPAEDAAKATAEYRRDSDPLGRFLEACVVASPGDRVQASVFHSVFNAWATANSASEWKQKGLANALKERGFESFHSNVNWWLNVKLTKTVNDFVDHEGKPLVDKGEIRAGDDTGGDNEIRL